MLHHVALNLIKADKLVKRGIQTRRKLAGWDHNFLAHLLGVKGAYTPSGLGNGHRRPPGTMVRFPWVPQRALWYAWCRRRRMPNVDRF